MFWLWRCSRPLQVCEERVSQLVGRIGRSRKGWWRSEEGRAAKLLLQLHSSTDPARTRTKSTDLKTNRRNLILAYVRVSLNDIRQRTSLHKLHHNPQLRLLLRQERLNEVDNVRMLAILHHHNLIHNQLLALLMSQIHLLDRDLCARTLLAEDLTGSSAGGGFADAGDVDGTGGALADFLLLVVRL